MTSTHNYAKLLPVAAISPMGLAEAMNRAPMTTKQLAERVGISLTYASDITNGRRTLKRSPELRNRIAEALGVPRHWIEVERPDPEAVACPT